MCVTWTPLSTFYKLLEMERRTLIRFDPKLPVSFLRGWHQPASGCTSLGRVDELFDAHPRGHQMNEGEKGLAQFLIPGRDTAKLFELIEEPFHLLA